MSSIGFASKFYVLDQNGFLYTEAEFNFYNIARPVTNKVKIKELGPFELFSF